MRAVRVCLLLVSGALALREEGKFLLVSGAFAIREEGKDLEFDQTESAIQEEQVAQQHVVNTTSPPKLKDGVTTFEVGIQALVFEEAGIGKWHVQGGMRYTITRTEEGNLSFTERDLHGVLRDEGEWKVAELASGVIRLKAEDEYGSTRIRSQFKAKGSDKWSSDSRAYKEKPEDPDCRFPTSLGGPGAGFKWSPNGGCEKKDVRDGEVCTYKCDRLLFVDWHPSPPEVRCSCSFAKHDDGSPSDEWRCYYDKPDPTSHDSPEPKCARTWAGAVFHLGLSALAICTCCSPCICCLLLGRWLSRKGPNDN